MTYDSLLWASEGMVIPEVASFKEEGLVTPEGWEGEKRNMKDVAPRGNWTQVSCMKCKSADHYTIETFSWNGVD